MSETEDFAKVFVDGVEVDTSDVAVLSRVFRTEMTTGDGRTVDVRIVPYGEKISHNDGLGGSPRGIKYEEEWLPGVFSHQLNAAHRVIANYEHGGAIGDIVGKGIALRESSDGFHGTFRLLQTQSGETMLELIREGAVDGVSVEARLVKNVRNGKTIQRAKANLMSIAFTRFAAYKGARVLALREEQEETVDASLLPVDMDAELVARCRRLGIRLPQRYEAHPDEDGHPDTVGTSAGSAPATPDNENYSEV